MDGHDVSSDDSVEVLLAGSLFRQVRGQVPVHFDVWAIVVVVPVISITEFCPILFRLVVSIVVVAPVRRFLPISCFFRHAGSHLRLDPAKVGGVAPEEVVPRLQKPHVDGVEELFVVDRVGHVLDVGEGVRQGAFFGAEDHSVEVRVDDDGAQALFENALYLSWRWINLFMY